MAVLFLLNFAEKKKSKKEEKINKIIFNEVRILTRWRTIEGI
jgi:hypothetical protein